MRPYRKASAREKTGFLINPFFLKKIKPILQPCLFFPLPPSPLLSSCQAAAAAAVAVLPRHSLSLLPSPFLLSTLLPSAHPPAAEPRSSGMTAAADATTLPPPSCFLLPLPRLRLPSHPPSSFPSLSLRLKMLHRASAEYVKCKKAMRKWSSVAFTTRHRSPRTHRVFPPSPLLPLFFPLPLPHLQRCLFSTPDMMLDLCDTGRVITVSAYTFRHVITHHSIYYCHCQNPPQCNNWSIQIISWSCLSFLMISVPDLQMDKSLKISPVLPCYK